MEIECAHCGNKQLSQVPGTWTPLGLGEEGLMQGPAVPVVMLGCNACGFVMMFSAQAIKPQPWPENPPQQQG
ncbi:MAG TPA: hypothetical protein VNT01_12110 [Symbiobacteriaceae bacterium]|nr:hypothetical protein [Symbiobacteriaceae bacterium]